jgi:hypothetical protein
MRGRPWRAVVLTALFATSAAAPAPGRAPQATGPLLPLSVADETRAQSGCTCTFLVGRGRRSFDLLQLSGRVLLSRTRAGLNICPISEAQFQAISGPVGSARCGGRRITVRSGPTREVGGDQADSAATVTVTRGGRTQELHGTWACAC